MLRNTRTLAKAGYPVHDEPEIVVTAMSTEIREGKHYSYGELYRVNLELGRVSKCPGGPLYLDNYEKSMVALDDNIYVLGEDFYHGCRPKPEKGLIKEGEHLHSKASCIDLINYSRGWKKIPDFKSTRYRHLLCVPFKGKLFLFGGVIRHDRDGSFSSSPGEFFDPKHCGRGWRLLPPLKQPKDVSTSRNYRYSSALVDLENDRIIVSLVHLRSIYAYYPDRYQWECLVDNKCGWSHQAVLFDGMILFYHHIFSALDLVTKEGLEVGVSPGSDSTFLYQDYDAFFPLSPPGTFCLAAWSYETQLPNKNYVNFVKFRVERSDSKLPLVITSISRFKLDCGGRVVCYVPIGDNSSPNRTVLPKNISPHDIYFKKSNKMSALTRRLELKTVEIVVRTLRSGETPKGRVYEYGELYTVDLTAGRMSKCPGSELYLDDCQTYMLASGQMIYVLGGNRKHCADGFVGLGTTHLHLKASCIDLVNSNNGWTKIPPFRSLDSTPICVSLNGKLFLFKGNVTESFGEVFDPERGTWDFLPEPPPPPSDIKVVRFSGNHISSPVLVDHDNNRIIVHFKHMKSIYAYYPDKCEWVCLVHNTFRIWPETAAIVDGMLVFHLPESTSYFIAFDLVAKTWLKPAISPGFDVTLISSGYDALIPMAPSGTLCFGAFSTDHDMPDKTHLTFVKFRVERTGSRDPLVTFISHNEFDIECKCCVTSYVPIVPIQ